MYTTNIPFSIFAVFLIVMLWLCIRYVMKSQATIKDTIVRPMYAGVIAVIFYTLFVNAPTRHSALLFDGLYFVMTDWLALFMFFFIMDFVNYRKRRLDFVWYILAGIDSISLVVNTWTEHTFTLDLTELPNGTFYWGCTFTPLHYIHLSLCYVMVISTFVHLVIQIIRLPWFYKKQSIIIVISYFVVIIANFISYSLDTTIDFSVVLYSALAAFISIYSVYSAPRQLITKSILQIHKNILDGIVFFDSKATCIYRNQMARELFPTPEDAEAYRDKWINDRASLKAKKDADLIFEGLDTGYIVNNESNRYEIDYHEVLKNGHLFGYSMQLKDRTDEINQYLHDRFVATHDQLTSIFNRQHFFDVCNRKLKSDMSQKWVMVGSNIKDFKLINEYFGQAIADKILIEHAKLFNELSHKENVYGRIGDDRFAIMVKKEYFREGIFLDAIGKIKSIIDNGAYKLHFYAGVYEIPQNTENAQAAYDKAMLSISTIKGDYQKTFAYYDSKIMEKLLAEKNIVNDFERAIHRGDIEPHLQPIISADGTCLGAELLARWHHAERGLLMPKSFLEILEHTNIIHKLDLYIWEEAAKILHEWKEKGITDLKISVNASTKDMYYMDISEKLIELSSKYDFDPQNLIIEFTEDILTSDLQEAVTLFQKLQSYGFKIGIDDFGRGYSSLNLLKDINADFLKIDMIFVEENENQKRSNIIIQFITTLSESLNMKVIAEGVENIEQMNLLKEMGTTAFQGFYFSRAIPKASFEEKYLR